jgi:alpha amylase-like protein
MSATLVEPIQAPFTASTWFPYPSVYEINTWVWLTDLRQKYGRDLDLSSVPSVEWDEIAGYGFDAVWFMGVWERSPLGIAIANQNKHLIDDFRRALPDFRPEDNVGSPYCVRRYVVDPHLGGPEGLAVARQELSTRGINVVLDFVPNHVAPDHPWVIEHPEYFICGNCEDLRKAPSSYLESSGKVFACGKDPYFPAWVDVLQLNAFEPGLRHAVIETVSSIAQQCDGIRCDMAMLFLNAIFERTWGDRAGPRPATEYWSDVISATKGRYPGFLFIAEAYWDLEWELQQKGFDFCYDKKLFDRLEHSNAETIRLHLCADLAYQRKLVRFIENHDEPRAAATFSRAKERAAALTVSTLPGLKLFHEGQFEGRKVRPPVFLSRRPDEAIDEDLRGFYRKLLLAINRRVFREGEWNLCEKTGWPDNASFQNLVAWHWVDREARYLIVVNLSDLPAQALVHLRWNELGGRKWHLKDVLSGAMFERHGGEMQSPGLYVELAPWDFHFFEFLRTNKT